MYNRVTLVGRLGADPESRKTQTGTAMTSFSLATSASWKNKAGKKETKTDWHRIVAFNRLADFCRQYISKGNLVLVEGCLSNRVREKNGNSQKSIVTEIVANSVHPLEKTAKSRPPEDEDGKWLEAEITEIDMPL
ncbi:MAG: single-stranded DNA-binding protein [Syntrophales bacterium]